MTYELHKLRKLEYYIEPNGSYATSVSGTQTYSAIKALEDSATVELLTEQLEQKPMMQRVDDNLFKVNARRRCNVSFDSYLCGTGTSASNGILAASSPLGDMLKTIMGGEHRTTGSGVSSVTNAGQFVVDGLANDLLYAGASVGLINTANGLVEAARIESYSTASNTIHLASNLQTAPVSGAIVYGAATYYLTQDPNNSLQFHVVGANTNDTWVACGLQGGFGLKLENGQLPTISFKLENGATWVTGSTETLDIVNYTDATPPPQVDALCKFYVRGANSTTPASSTVIDVKSVEITPNIKYLDVTTERGVGNILRKRRDRNVPVCSGKFQLSYYVDKTYFTARDNRTVYGFEFQVGNQPGNTVHITMPYVQITNVQVVDAEGMASVEVSFDAYENRVGSPTWFGGTTNTIDIYRSAFSIALI